ncbi:MAG: hypothetical protein ABIF40_04080 [archaeon]
MLEQFPSYKKGQDLVKYCKAIACTVHSGVSRDNGLAYTDHLEDMVEAMECVLKPSEYSAVAKSAAWLHDGPEDTTNFDVFNPYNKKFQREKNTIYLNDLLTESKEQGKHICYIVDRLTRREGVSYQEYMHQLCRVGNKKTRSQLNTLTIAAKIMDRMSNTVPDELINLNEELEFYRTLHVKGMPLNLFESFYKKQKVLHTFQKHGDMKYNPSLFFQAKIDRFYNKKLCFAVDNLQQYLSQAEEVLLVQFGKKNNHFDIDVARKNELFDYDRLREKFIVCAERSLAVLQKQMPFRTEAHIYVMMKTGYNRDWEQINGYTSVLKEIQNRLLKTGQEREQIKFVIAELEENIRNGEELPPIEIINKIKEQLSI